MINYSKINRKYLVVFLIIASLLILPSFADTAGAIKPVTPSPAAQEGTLVNNANNNTVNSPSATQSPIDNITKTMPVEPVFSQQTQNAILKENSRTLPDNYFFMVMLGSMEYGNNRMIKSAVPLTGDENFQNGYYLNGRLAYYLKAKIKGKYIISSNLDTEKEEQFNQGRIFRNLDPDKYYPVYGDSSKRIDEVNSQGKFYLLVKRDKSEGLWGNFNTGLTGTQLASFDRSLYGGKIYLESVSTNMYSEPNTKFILYNAQAKTLASHNEFIGTGGSLYYLRHQKIIEGSEKITIEIRDKFSNLATSSVPARVGLDYEIDYDRGRITFKNPVNSIVSSNTLYNQTLLDGNKVFIIVDYEYEPQNAWDKNSYGVRYAQNLTNNVSLGGTYVLENKTNTDYKLGGLDALIHLGGKSYFAAEYAGSKEQQMNNFMSYDGGLNFMNMPDNAIDGRAGSAQLYLKPNDKIEFNGYANQTSPGFSSTNTATLQGAKKIGFSTSAQISKNSEVLVRYDYQKLNQNATYLTPNSLNTAESKIGVVQYKYKKGKWAEYVEYSHFSNNNVNPVLSKNIAAKVEYTPNSKLNLYVQNQTTLQGDKNNQGIIGFNWKMTDKISAGLEEIMSTLGTGTRFNLNGMAGRDTQINTSYTMGNNFASGSTSNLTIGGQSKLNDHTSVYSNFMVNESLGRKTTDISYGTVSQINPKTQIYFENKNQYNEIEANQGLVLGTHFTPNDVWDIGLSYEKGNFNQAESYGLRNSGALSLGYTKENLKGFLKGELRKDNGNQQLTQYLVYTRVEWKLSNAFYFDGKCDFSKTFNSSASDAIVAKSNQTNIGIAYRPKASRFNCLAKYTRLDNISAPGQTNLTDLDNTINNIYAFEGVYKITNKIQFMGKYAYKDAIYLGSPVTIRSGTTLGICRANYHLDNKTDFSLEYRKLYQNLALDENKGFLVELSKKVYANIWVGAGYNFTNFGDNFIEQNSYSTQGWFIRMIGNY